MGFRPWAFWRRIQYAVGFFSFWGMIVVLVFFVNFYQAPNCLDGVMNGDESGIDCGGGCVQVCVADVLPPRVVWVESFEINEGQYNAVAYIENPNRTVGAPELNYTFELLSNGQVVGESTGVMQLPPNTIYPVFAGRLDVGVEVTNTRIDLEMPDLWLPSTIDHEQFRSTDINLTNADDRPKLMVEVENTSLTPASDVEVVATVFNEKGEAVTASQTFIESIEPRSTQEIVFTWPNPIAKTVKSCIIPTDVALAIDLSGSMNNDGGDPPQPITQALQAASQFAGSLRTEDQVAVITFATEAEVVTGLNPDQTVVAQTVSALTIDPKSEAGFTNTVDALVKSRVELNSSRHNKDARRVLVLLTDGLPTADGDEDVVSAAITEAVKLDEGGVEIYAIGLGSGVDGDFVRSIASDPANVYFAPTGKDLNEIYSKITTSLCEAGPTKIEVIAKTKTDFEPIK